MNSSYKGEHRQYKYDTEGSYVSKQAGNKSIIKIRPEEEQITVTIPAIVPAEQWDYAQELLGQSKRKHLSISLTITCYRVWLDAENAEIP